MIHFLDLSSLRRVGEEPESYFAVSYNVASWLTETFGLDVKKCRKHSLFSKDDTPSGVYIILTSEQEMLMRLKFQ